MNIQDIFNTDAVKSIEVEILTLVDDTEHHWKNRICNATAIRHLLRVRKNILDNMFVMNEEYKALLNDFNEALKTQLIKMRKRMIALHETARNANQDCDIETTGKCFLGFKYSKIHPVQTMRAKKMWGVLNGTYDTFMPLYEDGVCRFSIMGNNEPDSENQLLYLQDSIDNWNEGLDREMTADMNLINPFHNLFSHLDFSIFDLLWVRDFNIEITTETNYHTYPKDEESCDDIDWGKCDYF